MNAPLERGLEQESIAFQLNGVEVTALPGETLIQVADRLGVPIPRLCYKPGMRADGNCRSCMVEIKGERVLAPSCCRSPPRAWKCKATAPARSAHRR
jgi:formate dehydrogenase major subunit